MRSASPVTHTSVWLGVDNYHLRIVTAETAVQRVLGVDTRIGCDQPSPRTANLLEDPAISDKSMPRWPLCGRDGARRDGCRHPSLT